MKSSPAGRTETIPLDWLNRLATPAASFSGLTPREEVLNVRMVEPFTTTELPVVDMVLPPPASAVEIANATTNPFVKNFTANRT